MNELNYMKAGITALFAFLASMMGVLFVPVMLMVACNVIDYVTGVIASPYRDETIDSYKGIKGIAKKVCMWLLVVVGAILDQLIIYAGDTIGYEIPFTFLFACVVAIWIICNELISILENITDMGVPVPSFLKPVVEKIKSQVESTTGIEIDSTEDESTE